LATALRRAISNFTDWRGQLFEGDRREVGGVALMEYDGPGVFSDWGSRMGWVLRLVETGVEGPLGSVDVLEIDRPGNLDSPLIYPF